MTVAANNNQYVASVMTKRVILLIVLNDRRIMTAAY